MKPTLQRLLVHPQLPQRLALLAVVLAAPSLFMGLCGDDYFHRTILLGIYDRVEPLTGLFTFLDGGAINAEMKENGLLPWWTSDNLRVSLFRPVAALTHMLDYALWPDRYLLHHAHSLLWGAAGVLLVGRIFQRISPGTLAAGVACVVFAVEDAHAMVFSWIANRNALLTLVFGALGVLAHLRWREEGRAAFGVLSTALIGVGLLCGEATLGAVAYIGAWQLTLAPGSLVQKGKPLLPLVVMIVVWRLLYNHMGYGAAGSGLYIDPGGQPLRFGVALLERWPILMLGQWFQAPIDLWPFLQRGGQLAMTAAGVVSIGAVGWLLTPLLRARAEARFYAVGMAVSLVPLCAAFPMDRLLIFAGVGAAGLLGMLIADPGSRRRAAMAMALLHIPFAAVMLVGRVMTMPLFAGIFAVGAEQAPADEALTGQTLVFLNGNDFAVTYTGVMRALTDAPEPKRVAQLTSMFSPSEVLREDEDTLLITVDGGLLVRSIDRLFRDTGEPFAVGERIERADMVIEIASVTEDGRPEMFRADFHEPLESDRYRWVRFTEEALIEVEPPAIGERLELPALMPTQNL